MTSLRQATRHLAAGNLAVIDGLARLETKALSARHAKDVLGGATRRQMELSADALFDGQRRPVDAGEHHLAPIAEPGCVGVLGHDAVGAGACVLHHVGGLSVSARAEGRSEVDGDNADVACVLGAVEISSARWLNENSGGARRRKKKSPHHDMSHPPNYTTLGDSFELNAGWGLR
jgi:hypothetical protein